MKGDSAVIELPRYGSKLRLSDASIPIENSIISFNDFGIKGLNGKVAKMNGEVNIGTMDMDLRVNGKNIQFIGSEQRSYSEVFGKGFADISAKISSKASAMQMPNFRCSQARISPMCFKAM